MKFKNTEENGVPVVNLMEGEEILMTVSPKFGAKLAELKLNNGKDLHQVIWEVSPEDLKSGDWYKSALLFPYPNRLEGGKYTFEGSTYQFPINEPDKGNQLHGLIANVPFEVTDQQVNDQKAILKLTYRYDGSLAYYPFPFDFTVTYCYQPDAFEVLFDVKNTGDSALPFGLGWHPYFQIDGNKIDQYIIEVPALSERELNKNSIPTGKESSYKNRSINLKETRLDHAFMITDGNLRYSLKDERSRINISMKASEGFDFLQLFTPPGDESVAIEPMTCNVNAFNNGQGLKVLKAGERFNGKFHITLNEI